MKRVILLLSVLFICSSAFLKAQDKFYTKTGKISLFSSNAAEDISAINKSVVVLLNTKTGELQFAVLMKGFEFKKALMQEHFNTRYVESDKFPQSQFKGQVVNNSNVDYSKDGTYNVIVKGSLTIHGETKDVETAGTITVKDGKISTNSVFTIAFADYKIPSSDQVGKSIKVTVDCGLEPLK